MSEWESIEDMSRELVRLCRKRWRVAELEAESEENKRLRKVIGKLTVRLEKLEQALKGEKNVVG